MVVETSGIRMVHPPRPMVWVALSHICGLVLGLCFPWIPIWVPGVIAGMGILLVGFNLRRSRRSRGPAMGSGWPLLLAIATVGWFQSRSFVTADAGDEKLIVKLTEEKVVIAEGRLAAEPQRRESGWEMVIAEPRLTPMKNGSRTILPKGRLAVHVSDSALERGDKVESELPLPGERLRLWGRVRAIEGKRAPSPFNAEMFAMSRGIVARMSVYESSSIEWEPARELWFIGLHGKLRELREGFGAALDGQLASQHQPLARALLLGQADRLPRDLRDRFANAGLAHLLAVSGMNAGFVLVVLLIAGRAIGLGSRVCAGAGIVGIIAYTLLIGMQPPVIRAATMSTFLLVGFMMGRLTTPLASLATAAFVTLLADPRSLLRIDWQLSYVCVTSIVLIAPVMQQKFASGWSATDGTGGLGGVAFLGRWMARNFVLLPLIMFVAVQIGIAPLQFHYFQQFNLLSPLANLIAVPFSLLAIPAAVVAVATGWIPVVSRITGAFTDWIFDVLHWVAALVDHIPFASISLRKSSNLR